MAQKTSVAARVSVLMPSYNQNTFLARAIDSLLAQSLSDWELILVDDGSTDGTFASAQAFSSDPRIHRIRLETNLGVGAAINIGMEHASAPFISYLPTDDVYYRDHLASLIDALQHSSSASLAYSGVRHHYNRSADGQIPGYSLQLVQVLHRNFPERWIERQELVTDDLERLYWTKLARHGEFVQTGLVTCEWVDHPAQLHKLIREPVGGINPYRQHFAIPYPLRFHSSVGNAIDEVEHYRAFRERSDTPPAADGLTILLVGELAYNPERVLALEERGHRLFGLWMPDPYWYNTVGPLPFGHVTDLPRENWRQAIRDLKPDLIYALLNWQAVPFVHQVLQETGDIPFIWHFKEGPFISLEKGHWQQLVEIYRKAGAHIFTSPEMRDWFATVIPAEIRSHPSLILDGDLPKREWFERNPSPRLSHSDGEFHTVVPGRPIGLHPSTVADLARNHIHLHFYGNFTQGQWKEWIEKTQQIAPTHIHLHPQVDQENWVSEFSQYDAGWLHFFESHNSGDIRQATWDDLNIPARISTLAAAGLPVLQRRNTGHIVATQSLVQQFGIGLFFDDMDELRSQLENETLLTTVRANSWKERYRFSFDDHADVLIAFFQQVINRKSTPTIKKVISSSEPESMYGDLFRQKTGSEPTEQI